MAVLETLAGDYCDELERGLTAVYPVALRLDRRVSVKPLTREEYERGDSPLLRETADYGAIIERCPDTGLYVGYVPGLPGAHSQGETIDELNANLAEVIEMLLEDGEPAMESEFIGTQRVQVG